MRIAKKNFVPFEKAPEKAPENAAPVRSIADALKKLARTIMISLATLLFESWILHWIINGSFDTSFSYAQILVALVSIRMVIREKEKVV